MEDNPHVRLIDPARPDTWRFEFKCANGLIMWWEVYKDLAGSLTNAKKMALEAYKKRDDRLDVKTITQSTSRSS